MKHISVDAARMQGQQKLLATNGNVDDRTQDRKNEECGQRKDYERCRHVECDVS